MTRCAPRSSDGSACSSRRRWRYRGVGGGPVGRCVSGRAGRRDGTGRRADAVGQVTPRTGHRTHRRPMAARVLPSPRRRPTPDASPSDLAVPAADQLPIDEYESLAASHVVDRLANLDRRRAARGPALRARPSRTPHRARPDRPAAGSRNSDMIDPVVRSARPADVDALRALEVEARAALDARPRWRTVARGASRDRRRVAGRAGHADGLRRRARSPRRDGGSRRCRCRRRISGARRRRRRRPDRPGLRHAGGPRAGLRRCVARGRRRPRPVRRGRRCSRVRLCRATARPRTSTSGRGSRPG